MKSKNLFEDKIIAEQWIKSIETDESSTRDKEIYPFLLGWTKEINPKIIVEIGAGQGICSSKIDITNNEYIGIEPSTYLVDRAKELYKEDTNKKFIIADSYNTTLADESVDAIFSIGVWFHIEDLDGVHKEMSRILKKGGKFVIFNANPELYNIWESWFEDYEKEKNVIKGKFRISKDLSFENIFYLHSEKEILDSMNKFNLKVNSIQKFGFGKREKEHRDGTWIAIVGVKN